MPSSTVPPQVASTADRRTLMAAVVFVDIIGFSKKAVSDQMAAKEALAIALQHILAPFAEDSRIILDTGDGAGVTFLIDPEHALYFSLRLRLELDEMPTADVLQNKDLKLGINLGPIKRITDVNGHANVVGEGINSAERIMSFSSPGEIAASRSFRDAVSCLRASYRDIFEPLGARADKHGREHEVFRVRVDRGVLLATGDSLQMPGRTPTQRRSGLVTGVAAIAAIVAVLAGLSLWRWTDVVPDAMIAPVEVVKQLEAAPAPAPEKAATVEGGNRPDYTVTNDKPAHEEQVAREEPIRPVVAPKAFKPAQQPARSDSSRCQQLLQRAQIGESLNVQEQSELKNACR